MTLAGRRVYNPPPFRIPFLNPRMLAMANTKSAAKAARQSLKRKAVNDARRSRVKSSVKKSEAAIDAGDKSAANAAFQQMQAELMRGARKGIVHPNAVARKMSRLSKRIKAIKA